MLPVQLGIAPPFLELTQLLHVSMVDNCLSYQILPACHGQQVSSNLASLLSWCDLRILIAGHLDKQPLLCGKIIPRYFKFAQSDCFAQKHKVEPFSWVTKNKSCFTITARDRSRTSCSWQKFSSFRPDSLKAGYWSGNLTSYFMHINL